MNDTKPIKRAPELQPLSREHHDGLLFVWKLRQGLRKNITHVRIAAFVSWFWKNHIRPHFFQEEKVLMNAIPGNALTERMKTEHEHIRELIIEIDRDPMHANISELANQIERHIRFEERELFQYVEGQLSQEQLAVIKCTLDDHPVSCGEWKDEFWV